MVPKPKETAESTVFGSNYPTIRLKQPRMVPEWLKYKKIDDDTGGLWRVHDSLYDLTDFINVHPGGPSWLKVTKGTDVTEAFEVHHLTSTARVMLKKYFVRKATTPRHSPYTFKEDGFYMTLKRNVVKALKDIPDVENNTKYIIDGVCAATFIFSVLAANFNSYLFAAIAGIFLTLTVIAAHNFFHQKDNIRMYYFDLSFLSSCDWRISHALSHHLFTNTVVDLEITAFEPMLQFLPKSKSIFSRYISWLYSPIVYMFLYFFEFLRRMVTIFYTKTAEFHFSELIKLLIPLSMYIFSGNDIITVFKLWAFTILVASFHFGIVGLNAAHHHPKIFHDGDAVREEDWGINQMCAVVDRYDITGNLFLVLTNFGDHCLHHFFPTIDHGKLNYLYPILYETCKQFNVELRFTSQLSLVKGQFQQLARITPNPKPSVLKKTF